MDAALAGEFARVPGGGVFLAIMVGVLDEAVAMDDVTVCEDAGFAAVVDEGAASVWAAAGSWVAATGASLSAEVAPGFSGCGEESDCWLTNMSRNCFLPAGPAAIHLAANEISTIATITAAKRCQLPC